MNTRKSTNVLPSTAGSFPPTSFNRGIPLRSSFDEALQKCLDAFNERFPGRVQP